MIFSPVHIHGLHCIKGAKKAINCGFKKNHFTMRFSRVSFAYFVDGEEVLYNADYEVRCP